MATPTELLLQKTLQNLLEQQSIERASLSEKLERLEKEYLEIIQENNLIRQQYNEISLQLTTLNTALKKLNNK
ncbi:hypothetical protein [Haemophilus haemolyticus]|uniref:hypothetical protein n=1 Tax=Haemophilus haemolyticus TaxID=726 RepID=UPI0010658CDA